MEREISSSAKDVPPAVNDDATAAASLEALEAQQETLQKNLDAAQTKLATARIGESLERNQQSEKLEIIEQPTAPQDPVRPNRPKVAGLAVLLAAAAGAGLAFVAELADKAIRRSSDIFAVVDSRLVVSIPYITTLAGIAPPQAPRRIDHRRPRGDCGRCDDRGLFVTAARSHDHKGAGWAVSVVGNREQDCGLDQAGD